MQYGSIGWSVGATLGYAQAVPEKRVIACIGDGSFQVGLAHHINKYIFKFQFLTLKFC
jgi:TPP-dependent 2-oxoacid decarboxylase